MGHRVEGEPVVEHQGQLALLKGAVQYIGGCLEGLADRIDGIVHQDLRKVLRSVSKAGLDPELVIAAAKGELSLDDIPHDIPKRLRIAYARLSDSVDQVSDRAKVMAGTAMRALAECVGYKPEKAFGKDGVTDDTFRLGLKRSEDLAVSVLTDEVAVAYLLSNVQNLTCKSHSLERQSQEVLSAHLAASTGFFSQGFLELPPNVEASTRIPLEATKPYLKDFMAAQAVSEGLKTRGNPYPRITKLHAGREDSSIESCRTEPFPGFKSALLLLQGVERHCLVDEVHFIRLGFGGSPVVAALPRVWAERLAKSLVGMKLLPYVHGMYGSCCGPSTLDALKVSDEKSPNANADRWTELGLKLYDGDGVCEGFLDVDLRRRDSSPGS